MNRIRNLTAVALALVLGCVAEGRPSVTIVNPGFEQPALGLCSFGGPLTGWVDTGGGPWRCGSGGQCLNSFPGGPAEGLQVAFTNSTADISQVLTATLQPLQTYTLKVKVGRRLDCCQMTSYKVQLSAGASVLATDSNTQNPAPGTWATSTVVYTVPANHPAIGQPLKITLNLVAGGQADFDDVTLTTGAGTPCPADMAPAGGNGVVNIDDLLAVINFWGPCAAAAPCHVADIAPVGGNGVINIDDLLGVINAWGACP